MQSRLTPSSVATTQITTLSAATCTVCAFSYLYSSFAVRSPVLQRSQQVERHNKKTSEEGPSNEKLLLFLRPTPMEKMAVAYDVI